MADQEKTPPIKRNMLIVFTLMLLIIGYGASWATALTVIFVVAAIVLNGLVVVEGANWLKTGIKFDRRLWTYGWAAIVLDIVALYMGHLTLILAAGVGVPLLINVFIAIEDKVRGKK